MDIQFYGANCLKLSTKKANIVVDDNLKDVGLSSPMKPGDIAVFTGAHGAPGAQAKMVISYPGEYEVSDISIQGVQARAHIDEEGQMSATMYKIIADDIRAVAVGHVYPDLDEEQLEALGTVDVLFIPVGGNGYTLDATGALKLIKKIEPKIVVPTHYADPKINYPVPQQDLETALKNMSMEATETLPKLRVKPAELTDTTKLIVLERQ